MTTEDILFKDLTHEENVDYNSFSHFGWEGKDAFALFKFADAYFMGANFLVDKFNASGGHNDILDGLGLPICFLYRHFTELHLKFLIRKFGCSTDSDYKELVEKGHDLIKLWGALKPILKSNKDRVGSTVNIGCLEHYIHEIDSFDKNSMTVRYPLDKKLNQTNEEIRLDVNNLHDRMCEFHDALLQIDCDIDNQLKGDVAEELIAQFIEIYKHYNKKISSFLATAKSFADKEKDKCSYRPFDELESTFQDEDRLSDVLKVLDSDLLILLESLFYTGRAIHQRLLVLPKDRNDAAIDTVKSCVLFMQWNGYAFDNNYKDSLQIFSVMASSIDLYVNTATSVLNLGL